MYTKKVTCWRCGEEDALSISTDGCCWECGANLVKTTRRPAAAKTAEERAAEADAAGQAAAEKLFPVLVSKLATCDKFKLHEIIRATCRQNGYIFASHFTRMVLADERFASVVAIMSPAQKRADW